MSSKYNILLLNGPNLNMLGVREPGYYGHLSLTAIEQHLQQQATKQQVALDCFQANSEVALRDALLAVGIPFVEVHLSNIHKREPFRHHSYFSDVAESVICGCGAQGYDFALQFAVNYLSKK